MAEMKTYRARERGYIDDRMIEEGETFTSAAPKGRWMALLDKDGNEVEDPEPEPKPDLAAELKAANERAEAAEKEVGELRTKLAAFDRDGDGKPGGSKPVSK